MAPAAARTDVVATTGAVDEDTRNVEAPDADQLVEHLLDLVASEAEALLADDDRDGRLADLSVRTALASRDWLQHPDEAMRQLELAEQHPLTPRLLLATALAANTVDALAAVEERIATLPALTSPALALELAEAWLFRHNQYERAAAIVDRLLDGELAEPLRADAIELAALAHGAAGGWRRVAELRAGALTDDAAPDEVAATAALLLDRCDDAEAALATCWAALARASATDVATLGWLRVVDLGLDAAARLDDDRRSELLERRAAIVGALAGGAIEAHATRHAIASERARRGDYAGAIALWNELADDPAAALPTAGRRIAALAAAHAAAALDPPPMLAARRRLLESPSGPIAANHAWRALELAAAVGEAPVALGVLARAVADAAASPVAERWLDVVELPAPTASTIARLEARGGFALRWAAALAEARADVPRALELWRRAVTSDARLGSEHDHVVRLLHGDDEDELARAYEAWIAAEPDPRVAAALQCGLGVIDLLRGDFVAAEDSLGRAAARDPQDTFSRAGLAAVYRASRRYDQLAGVLGELATSLASREARATVAREYAELLDEHLGDPAGARAALERMIDDRPDDTSAMITLAKLHDRDEQWDRSIELRERAVAVALTDDRRGELWQDIALREERRGDRDAALAALERALAASPNRAGVRREQIRLHREAGRHARALELVRAELATDPPIARRMELQTEQAQLLTALAIEPENVVAAYLDVLSIEPDQTEALAGIEAPARALGLWDELARAFRGAPQTPRNLEVLAEALAKIAEWPELAEVRRRQLEAATAPADKAQRAAELARLYEHELGDVDGTIRMLALAQASVFDRARQHDLVRLLRDAKRWPELAGVLERELPLIPADDLARQVEVLIALGELRAGELARPADAITAYEGVLEREPKNAVATVALEKLYEQLGRDRELAHLLEQRADATIDPPARAALFARVAALRANRGDIDGALAAYTAAFIAEPANREVFTAMERVCYKSERWAATMQLYETALAHVESGKSRAYRLGDLYARRGNVQLNYLGQVDAAIASYQKVIEVDSAPANAVKVLDELCEQRRDWSPLVTAWERRAEVQRDPQRRAEALRAAAQLATTKLADPRAAVALNRKLLALDPGDRGAAAMLERHYEERNEVSGLIDVLKVRLQSTADNAQTVDILKRIARVSEEGARDVDSATEHYQKVLELQPENREALDALGRIYESTEQWAEFIDVTRRLIKVTGDRNTKALLYFKCGSVMEAKFGREHDAIRYYDAAIKTAPSCLPAVHGLRDLYRRREEWPRVIETLELEVKLWTDDKERAGVFAQIGRIYEKQLGDGERAMTYYESALQVDPECLPANQAVFEHFFDRGEWDKAQPIANALAQRAMRDGDPTTRSEFYRKRGVVARMTGDAKGAAESFIVALEVKPANAEALDDLGALAHEQPEAWDFDATYRELEKLYKKRDDADPLLARVHIGRAAIIERDGDLDQAAELYRQALELAPGDFTILSALCDFHTDMRHWREAVVAIQKFVDSGASGSNRLAALMRLAAIHADGEMDAPRAIAVLKDVIQFEPAHQDAYYLLAQQCFLIGRYADARTAIDRVIELATAPGQPLTAPALARYYYYKGRILDAAGDARAAAPQYRRAIDYDPGYAPPALVLARRAAESGDQRQAETLLIDAAHAAMAQGGPRAAVALQRGLARILLSSGDRPGAIDAYRGILNVDPDGASDRVALAEIYAVDDPARAIGELRKVLDRDIHHAPAYRLLASFYSRTGDTERANRVLTALDLLGFAEEADRATLQRLRAYRAATPLRRALDDDHRAGLLVTPAARNQLGDVWTALADEISALVAQPSLGENLAPVASLGDARLQQLVAEVAGLYAVEADVFVGERVPGLAAATAFPRKLLVIDRTLLDEPDVALRFLLGYAFEAIRGGYAALLQVGARQRRELAQLLRNLVSLEGAQGQAAELVAKVGARAQKILERHSGARDVDPSAWIDGMLACAKRAGLVACDDFAAAIWMVARLAGERPANHEETVALGAVLGGTDLVRFYLSDDYQQLRDVLASPA